MTSSKQPSGKNPLEWAVFGISSLLIVALVLFLVREIFQTSDRPALIRAHLSPPRVENGMIRYPVKVTNEGGRAAADVEIVVTARSDGTTRQAGFTLDFVPSEASRDGSVSFEGTERPEEVKCEMIGYTEP